MKIYGLRSKIGLSATLLTTSVFTAVPLADAPAHAQRVQPPVLSIFENVTLGPDFSPDPTTIRGISGGPLTASNIAGRAETATGPCAGFVDEQPDHTIQLTEFFSYLSIQVESPEDTTLVVRGPGGSWCNDDYQSNNPGIAGQWLSGSYQVWVGSYNRDSYHPYVIRITGNP
ncbi:MAG: hypothetical protein HC879_18935 [Leptolyngbyaceae cyanobacterium SL_5_9]|nr:hypothetical protein [Leptolyngbyaceae cyanobacterium SL_5_9]NJO74351.1 hypothetical protein [Leptolyngbyaceae cyanobacterium RM1_406_9]